MIMTIEIRIIEFKRNEIHKRLRILVKNGIFFIYYKNLWRGLVNNFNISFKIFKLLCTF